MRRALVQLGRSAGARAAATSASLEPDLEQPVIDQPVEVVGGKGAAHPDGGSRLVSRHRVGGAGDEGVQRPALSLGKPGKPLQLNIESWFRHHVPILKQTSLDI